MFQVEDMLQSQMTSDCPCGFSLLNVHKLEMYHLPSTTNDQPNKGSILSLTNSC